MKRFFSSLCLLTVLALAAGTKVRAIEPNAAGVYEIATPQDLLDWAALVNAGEWSAKAVLTADLDMQGAETGVFPVGGAATADRFVGSFDGQGHRISNFVLLDESGVNYGMFNTGPGVTLKDFWLDSSCSITGSELVGLIGRHDGAGTFENVGNCASVTGGGNNIGGFLGAAWGAGNGSTVPTIFRNCWSAGKVTTDEAHAKATDTGALSGWFNNGYFVFTNCWTAAEVSHPKSQEMYVFRNGAGAKFEFTNCYSLAGKQPNFTLLQGVTAADLATGAIAYQLNGDQSSVSWYQRIGVDAMPSPYASRGTVYLNGRLHCNDEAYEDVEYSNENKGIQKDSHDYANGICSFCGSPDVNYKTQNAEGYYEISDENALIWLSEMVKAGCDSIKAVLTADIDLAQPWLKPIGSSAVPFAGKFDGQGHRISGFNMEATGSYAGLFGYAVEADICNFSIEGLLLCVGAGNGAIGYAAKSNITNVHSALNINATAAGVTHTGGVIGEAFTETHLNRCSFSGSLTMNDTNHDCFGGICGYTDTGWFENCLNAGTVTFGAPNCYAGGILGYLNNASSKGLHNCLNVGHVTYSGEGAPTYGGALVGRLRKSPSLFGTSYWLEGSATCAAGDVEYPKGLSVASDALVSGEVTWRLNGESFLATAWFQTIGADVYPTLDPTHGIVYATEDGFGCVDREDESTFYSFVAGVVQHETAFVEETMAQQTLLDEYAATIARWSAIESFEAFCEAYTQALPQRDTIQVSAKAYAKYVDACQYAANYLQENNITGMASDVLNTYLTQTVEPGVEYPQGSYLYITDTRLLSIEQLAEETAFVNKMLEYAIAGGMVPGTEVTKLMQNPSFTEGFTGWNTEYEGGSIATGGETSIMRIARGLNNSSFDFHQTITGVPNGVYMVSLNGLFRASEDFTSTFYSGQFYLGENAIYMMSPGEDVISQENAVDKVNSYLEGDVEYVYEDIIGYVPNNMIACSYAFGAGRYQNFGAVEVTDSTLTFGVRNLGNGLENSWLPFGNVRIFYLGTPDEASPSLDQVVSGCVARAGTILAFPWSSGSDFAQYPNFSEALKEQLQQTIDAAAGPLTGAEKLQLIGEFSRIFSQIYTCRMAYIRLAAAAENLMDYVDNMISIELITEDEGEPWMLKAIDGWNAYQDGLVSAAQADSITEELGKTDFVLPMKNGAYQLASVDDLKLFSVIVANTAGVANAALTADLDMSEVEDFTPIGMSGHPFTGTFDGQGHKITGFRLTPTQTMMGLFGYVKDGAVKNFSISGTITCPGGGTGIGVIGWAEGATISNIRSSLQIAVTGTDVHHVGGVVGSLRVRTSIQHCTFSGSLSAGANNDCFGGVVGYTNEYCSITNCANYGTVLFTAPNCYGGGICGYLNNASFSGIRGCISVGRVGMEDGSTPQYGGAIMGRLRAYTADNFGTSYWLEGSATRGTGENQEPKCISTTATQMGSGEVCFALNEAQDEIVWFQNITEDPYPVLDDTHKVVIKTEEGIYKNEDGTAVAQPGAANSQKPMAVYDLSGRRVEQPAKGLYIVGGRKVVFK